MKIEIEREDDEMENETEKEAPESWEIQCWADTLIKAAEIKSDAEKMKLVQPYLDKKATAIRSISDLRDVAKKKGYTK